MTADDAMVALTFLSLALGATGLVVAVRARSDSAEANRIADLARREAADASDRADLIQDRIARVEEARRLDERRPKIDLSHSRKRGPSEIIVRNLGPIDLDDAVIEVVQKPPLVAELRFPDGSAGHHGSTGPIRLGDAASVTISENKNLTGGELALRISTRAGVEEWEQPMDVTVHGYAKVSRIR